MMWWSALAVGIGGCIGAILRYLIVQWAGRTFSTRFPYGTLIVNLSGSFALGILVGTGIEGWLLYLLGAGFLGAFTTYSTFSLDTLHLNRLLSSKAAVLYVGTSMAGGILLAMLGYGLTVALFV